MINQTHNKKGFTLVEVMVVTSIISLLSSVVLTVFTSPRQRANDATRVLNLKQIQNALELYYADHQVYPDTISVTGGCPSSVGTLAKCAPYSPVRNPLPITVGTDWDPATPLQQLVSGGYISKLPIDPLNRDGFWYVYRGRPQGYVLEGTLENGQGVLLIGGSEGNNAWMDLNNNGTVAGSDAAFVLQTCTGVTPIPLFCNNVRDYDCDGTYTVNDVTRVQEYIVGLRPLSQTCRGF